MKRINNEVELFDHFRSMGESKSSTEIEVEGMGKFRIFFQSAGNVSGEASLDSDGIVAREGEQFAQWDAILMKIEQTISRPSFETWFRRTTSIQLDVHHICVICHNSFQLDWLKTNYWDLLLAAIQEVTGETMEVEMIVENLPAK